MPRTKKTAELIEKAKEDSKAIIIEADPKTAKDPTPTETAPQQEPQPAPQPEPQPEPKSQTADTNKELLDAIASLTAAVQTRNVRESRQPIEDQPNLKDDVDKVLLNLYNN